MQSDFSLAKIYLEGYEGDIGAAAIDLKDYNGEANVLRRGQRRVWSQVSSCVWGCRPCCSQPWGVRIRGACFDQFQNGIHCHTDTIVSNQLDWIHFFGPNKGFNSKWIEFLIFGFHNELNEISLIDQKKKKELNEMKETTNQLHSNSYLQKICE